LLGLPFSLWMCTIQQKTQHNATPTLNRTQTPTGTQRALPEPNRAPRGQQRQRRQGPKKNTHTKTHNIRGALYIHMVVYRLLSCLRALGCSKLSIRIWASLCTHGLNMGLEWPHNEIHMRLTIVPNGPQI
jgi:hypothetical protein